MNPTNPTSKKPLSLYFFCNCAFFVFMIVAAFMIRSGQAQYMPHATIDKKYVSNVISSGETEAAWDALKHTEVARATGFQSVVTMMDVMQAATISMALFFVLNCYFLFRLRSPKGPTRVPVLVRS